MSRSGRTEAGQTTTRLSDLALVCSNCHRMIHRRSPWPTPIELGLLIAELSGQS
ncbi:HNH endonuclease [bacterium AH-315-A03]|nr:HNH endonuclease [bacterium AH-315-A03]